MWPFNKKIENNLIEEKKLTREEILKIVKEKVERIKIKKDKAYKDRHDYAISEEGVFYTACWEAKICPRCGSDIKYIILRHETCDDICENCNYPLMDLYYNVPISRI